MSQIIYIYIYIDMTKPYRRCCLNFMFTIMDYIAEDEH